MDTVKNIDEVVNVLLERMHKTCDPDSIHELSKIIETLSNAKLLQCRATRELALAMTEV